MSVRNICQLNLYIGIRYILLTIGEIFWYWIYSANNWQIYILVLDIFCQQLGDMFWYWIFSANNYGDIFWYWIYSANNCGIHVNYGVFVPPSGAGLQIMHFLECVPFKKSIFCNPTPSNWHISPNCWQNISNTNI